MPCIDYDYGLLGPRQRAGCAVFFGGPVSRLWPALQRGRGYSMRAGGGARRGGGTGGTPDGRLAARGDSGVQPVSRFPGRPPYLVSVSHSSMVASFRATARRVACSSWAPPAEQVACRGTRGIRGAGSASLGAPFCGSSGVRTLPLAFRVPRWTTPWAQTHSPCVRTTGGTSPVSRLPPFPPAQYHPNPHIIPFQGQRPGDSPPKKDKRTCVHEPSKGGGISECRNCRENDVQWAPLTFVRLGAHTIPYSDRG